MLRVALLALLLGGCPSTGSTGAECQDDRTCGGDICTRDGQCTPPGEVRSVKITWTVNGGPASAASCATTPNLTVYVDGDTALDRIGFEPVPCDQGVFNFDKLPTRYAIAELAIEGGVGARRAIDSANTAHFDIVP
jgi:hypothetical protein